MDFPFQGLAANIASAGWWLRGGDRSPADARSWTRGGYERDGLRDGNSIFIFEAAGLCIGHLGHLHQIPSPGHYAAIGRVDILMVPVDGGVTLAVGDMAAAVRRLRASVVLPMHWFSDRSLRRFLTEMQDGFDIVEAGLNEMAFSRRDLPARPNIMVLEPRWLD